METKIIRRPRPKNGNALMELAIISPFLVLLLFGVFSIGMSLSKSIQVSVVARDSGAMFMRYIDFSLTANKSIVVRIANGMGMTTTGGNGVELLSQVMAVTATECVAGGLTSTTCPNIGYTVFIKRQSVGNTSLYTSTFGTPSSSILGTDGSITAANYLTNASCRTTNFTTLIALNGGEFAYISEAYFTTPELDLPGYRNNTAIYQRAIF